MATSTTVGAGAEKKKRKKHEKSAQSQLAEKARDAATQAEEIATRTHLAADIEKAKKLRLVSETETRRESRERFERVVGGRASAALASIEAIGTVGRSRKYLYIDGDIEKTLSPLRAAIEDAETSLKHGLNRELKTPSQKRRIVFDPLPQQLF